MPEGRTRGLGLQPSRPLPGYTRPSCSTGHLLLPSVKRKSGGLGVGRRPVGSNGPARHARTSPGFACGQNTAGVSKRPILTRPWMAGADPALRSPDDQAAGGSDVREPAGSPAGSSRESTCQSDRDKAILKAKGSETQNVAGFLTAEPVRAGRGLSHGSKRGLVQATPRPRPRVVPTRADLAVPTPGLRHPLVHGNALNKHCVPSSLQK